MGRLLCASFALLVWGCNGEPKNSCVPYAHSVVSSGTATSNCSGLCVTINADASTYDLCVPDCSDGGQAVCASGSVCAQAPGGKSYCAPSCGDAGTCPSPLVCDVDAGACY